MQENDLKIKEPLTEEEQMKKIDATASNLISMYLHLKAADEYYLAIKDARMSSRKLFKTMRNIHDNSHYLFSCMESAFREQGLGKVFEEKRELIFQAMEAMEKRISKLKV
jgi:hypothetical protein